MGGPPRRICVTCVEFLFRAGASLHAPVITAMSGDTPLLGAVRVGDLDLVTTILAVARTRGELRACLDFVNAVGENVFHCVAQVLPLGSSRAKAVLPILHALLDCTEHLRIQEVKAIQAGMGFGDFPKDIANIVAEYLPFSAVDARNSSGSTPLMKLGYSRSFEDPDARAAAQLLVKHGADPSNLNLRPNDRKRLLSKPR